MDLTDPALPATRAAEELSVDLRLEGPLLDRRVAALHAHRSQIGAMTAALGDDGYHAWVADEQFVTAPVLVAAS